VSWRDHVKLKVNEIVSQSVKKVKVKKMAKHKVKMTPTPTKGKGHGKPSSSSREQRVKGETIDIKDCPLAMVEICPVKTTSIPRYNHVLTRSDSDGIGMEDMDTLQQELERMLTSIMVRKLHIKEEVTSLQNIEKWGKNKKTPGKRLGGKDEVDGKSKKLKLVTGKDPESRKQVHASHGQAFDPLENEQIKRPDIVSPPVIKNQIPPKFWKFVEPYCAQIQNKDIKFMEDFLKTQEDEDDLYEVPPLGQHYMIQWAVEDEENEKIKKEESEDGAAEEDENDKTEISPSGKVTQRLMQGLQKHLIEENMQAQDDRQERGTRDKDVKPNQSLIDSLKKVSNGDGLELKVKKELEDKGFLDPADENEDQEPEDDLILYEMVRCQKQLKKTAAHNQRQIKRMLKAGREEKIRQEIRERLGEADRDVRDAYTKILEVRSRKDSPSVEDRETAWKAIKVRNALLKALEAI